MKRMRARLKDGLLVGILLVLVGCSAAGQQSVSSSAQQPVPFAPQMSTGLNSLRTHVQARPRRAEPLVYALEEYEFSVTGYPQTANGNIAPTYTLAGGNTKIYEPDGLAIDSNGKIAIANANDDITLYPPGASGNTAPIATITCGGPPSQPGEPEQMTFDARGNLYVLYDLGYHGEDNAIEIYTPAQQSGCVTGAIIFGSRTGITEFAGIAVSHRVVFQAAGNGVIGFPVTDTGNVAPSVRISGHRTGLQSANDISFDGSGHMYVSENNDVRVFASSAHGNAKPIVVIAGSNTGIPDNSQGAATGIVVDKSGAIFVAVQSGSTNSILVFAPGANGNVAPRQVISGSNTELNFISVLAVKK